MTRLAIWNADGLLGREIKDTLAQRRDLWDDLKLLSEASEDALVTDIGGEAAFVLPASADNLEDVDLLFYCPSSADQTEIPDIVPRHVSTVVVLEDGLASGISPLVAGVPSTGAPTAGSVSSAHPTLIALAHLLSPLLPLGLQGCTASLLVPSSTRGQAGVDQLLDQARSILAFQGQPEDDTFGFQLAFNVVPASLAGERLVEPLREILGAPTVELAIQSSVGGVFHGLTLDLHVRFASAVDESLVREVLSASPVIEFTDHPETLGPIDVAGSPTLLLGSVETSTAPNSFWLRGVMDNLTLGGALNAIGVAEALLAAKAAGDPDQVM